MRQFWYRVMQDAQKLWQRSKDEEGGGGYLAWNWDSSMGSSDLPYERVYQVIRALVKAEGVSALRAHGSCETCYNDDGN